MTLVKFGNIWINPALVFSVYRYAPIGIIEQNLSTIITGANGESVVIELPTEEVVRLLEGGT